MATVWRVTPGTDRVQLNRAREAEVTFTVTNDGPVDDRAVLDVVPGDPAERPWFAVAEPQRPVPRGASVPFLVRMAVPPGAPPGMRWMQARVYSSDAAPEESSVLSDRVAFEVPGTAPVSGSTNRWLWLIPAAILVLAVLGVALFLVLRNGEGPDRPSAETPSTDPAPAVHASGQLALPVGSYVDLDEVVNGSPDPDNDIWIANWYNFFSVRAVFTRNGATITEIDPSSDAKQDCANASGFTDRVSIDSLAAGDVLCVRTAQGRLSVVTVDKPPTLDQGATFDISVTTFED
jgi:hypothetical protein